MKLFKKDFFTPLGTAISLGVKPSVVLEWIDAGMPVRANARRCVHRPTALGWAALRGIRLPTRVTRGCCVSRSLWRAWRMGRIAPAKHLVHVLDPPTKLDRRRLHRHRLPNGQYAVTRLRADGQRSYKPNRRRVAGAGVAAKDKNHLRGGVAAPPPQIES